MRNFLGVECEEARLGDFELLLARSVGPRILSLEFRGSGNIFAELPNEYLDYLDRGRFNFYGGHRLWVAPEEPAVTYLPDDHPVRIVKEADGIELIQAEGAPNGLGKSIRIQATTYADVITVDHTIKNEGAATQKLAPWAITQLKLGGTAAFPFKATIEENPLLPDRSLVLWPYTDIHDERIKIGRELVFVHSLPVSENALKIGVNNVRRWVAYFIDGYAFIKYSSKADPCYSLDLGAEGQCYCNHKFLELETLGLYREVEPGETAVHREVWRMVEYPSASVSEEALLETIKKDEMAEICLGLL